MVPKNLVNIVEALNESQASAKRRMPVPRIMLHGRVKNQRQFSRVKIVMEMRRKGLVKCA
jgi:hypothetical protein